MPIPVAQDVYDYLENYCIDNTIISEDWIDKRITRQILPYIERITRLNFQAIQTVTEYQSGNGRNLLYLDRRPVISIEQVTFTTVIDDTSNFVDSVELVPEEGIVIATGKPAEGLPRSVWPKGNYNIKVTYTYGYNDFTDSETGELVDIKEAIICMAAKKVLTQVGARTGGGNTGGQQWSRSFGKRGKYTEMLQECDQTALAILRQYKTSVVGA